MITLTASRLLTLAILSLLALAPAAHAQDSPTFFPNDATLDASNPTPDDAIVGYANQTDRNNRVNGTSPTIHLVTGGHVGLDLYTYNSSIAHISGGSVSAYIYASDSSTVNLSSGSVGGGIYPQNNSTININGGSIGNELLAYHSSQINMSDGSIGGLFLAQESSTVNISGGSVSMLALLNNISNVIGGIFGGVDVVYGTLDMTGGSVTGNINVSDSGTLNMRDGYIGRDLTSFNSTANLYGGRIDGNVIGDTSGTVNIYGGSIGGDLWLYSNSTMNLFGTDLSSVLINPDASGFSQYMLSGHLLDNTDITSKNLYLQNGTGAQFTITNVPAPGALLTALLGAIPGLGVLLRRRRGAMSL